MSARFQLPVFCVLYWSVWNVGTWQLEMHCSNKCVWSHYIWYIRPVSLLLHTDLYHSSLSTLYFRCFKVHIKIYPGIPNNITFLFSVCLYCVHVLLQVMHTGFSKLLEFKCHSNTAIKIPNLIELSRLNILKDWY